VTLFIGELLVMRERHVTVSEGSLLRLDSNQQPSGEQKRPRRFTSWYRFHHGIVLANRGELVHLNCLH
jgi:hypothetical protein